MSVTKNKQAYYTLEDRYDEVDHVKVKHHGYKITVKELSFFSDEEYYIKKITESSTGTGLNVKAEDLEKLEKLIIINYDKLLKQTIKYKEEHPNWDLKNYKEVKE